MDALRTIAMLLGIILHAAISYQIHPRAGWPVDNTFHSIGFDLTYHWIHAFRMQLFYLVAGFFARLLFLKIGEHAFVVHRFKRIVIPFVVSLLVIVPLTNAPFVYYESRIINLSSHQVAMHEAWRYILGWLTLSKSLGVAHLWFLYYLIIYYVGMLVMIRVFDRMKISVSEKTDTFIQRCVTNPVYLIFVSLMLTAILYLFPTPIAEVYAGIFPKIPNLLYYGVFFLFGWFLHRSYDYIEKFVPFTWPYLIIGTVLIVPIQYLIDIYETTQGNSHLTASFLIRLIGALQTWLLVYGMLGLFQMFFSVENKVMRYLSDACYWIYLAHLPIVVVLQIILLYSDLPGFSRFWIVTFIAVFITLLTYHFFVRHTIIGEVLHGKREKVNRLTVVESVSKNK